MRSLLFLLFCLVSIACTPKNKPQDFKPGEHKCNYCMMGISDMRFRSEIITHKGKIHHFDSIECMAAWSQKNPEKVRSAWVGDFFNNGTWISLSKAHILQSSKLKSPMGGGLSAYKSKEDLSRAKKLYEGFSLSEKELNIHVGKWLKKIKH